MQIDLGKIKINWLGAYSASTEYEKDDAVSYGGSSFIHVGSTATTGTAPTVGSDTSTWEILAAGVPTMTAQGEIVFQGSSGPEALAPGTSGYVLTTKGSGNDPEWALPSSRQNSTVIALPDTDHTTGSYRSGGVIVADGTLRVWGHAENSNLGQGSYLADRSAPIMPAFPKTSATVTKWRRVGEDNWCLMSDGSVYVWGRNSYGSLGVGNTSQVQKPTKVTALDGVTIVDIAVGYGTNWSYNHVMFLADDGTMYSCGYNGYGQLGLGDNTNRNTPTALSKTDWAKVVVAGTQYGRTHAIDTSGGLWSWGYNPYGELGIGSTTNANTPTQVTLPANCDLVSASEDEHPASGAHTGGHTIALLTDGRVYAFGLNGGGQLGNGTTTNSTSPQHISTLGPDNANIFACGGHHGFSIIEKDDGTIRTYGYNAHGQLGDGSTTNRSSPIIPSGISGNTGIRKILPFGGQTYSSVAVLFNNGVLKVAGYNGNGNLGIGSTTQSTSFVEVPLMKGQITDICCVGANSEVGLGILTDTGIYYQTGYAGESQLPEDDDDSTVPYPVAL